MGKEGLRSFDFDIPVGGEGMVRQAVMLNIAEEKLHSVSNLAKADNMEIQEITENAARSMENLIVQLEETLPMCELKGLDKQLRSIRGLLKDEVAEKFELQQHIEKESLSSRKSETIQNMMMAFKKTLGSKLPS